MFGLLNAPFATGDPNGVRFIPPFATDSTP